MKNGSIDTDTQIGDIGNYYGGLWVRYYEGKYYWGIENYDSGWEDPVNMWSEIPEKLYNSLIQYETKRKKILNK